MNGVEGQSSTWEFPAIEALGDAIVVAEVEGLGAGDAPVTMRLAYANRRAEKVFEITARPASSVAPHHADTGVGGPTLIDATGIATMARVGEIQRLLEVATSGQPDSWVSRHVGGWYESRAARLTSPDVVGARVSVLVVARELGTVNTIPSEAAGATRVALLLEISRRLGTAVREDQVAQVFFDLVCPALGADTGELAVVCDGGGTSVWRHLPGEGIWRGFATTTPADSGLMTVPLRAGAATVGAIRLPSDGEVPGRGRQEFIDTVAALVAQAVQRARLFDSQLEASLALQHALLPPVLPQVADVEFAARYRAGSGHEVGGDWYDVVPLASGWVASVIGDVQGHDLGAAALMGQVRSVIRSYLLDEQPPTAVLSSTNTFLLSLGLDRLVTVCIAQVHPKSGLVTLATAGHARPLLVTPGKRGELLAIPDGPPLGVLADVIWRERTTPLPERSTLVLYTDGLIERRTRPYDAGERQLLDLVALLPDVDAERLADAVLLMAGIEPPGPGTPPPMFVNEDDTALLLLRWRRGAPTRPDGGHLRTLPVAASSAVIARWYVDDLLRSWDVDEQTRTDAVLLTDEVVANAVRHADRTIRLDVTEREGQVVVEVFDDSHREPHLGVVESDATSGRGLLLVDALSDDWGIRMSQGDLGKTVWFTLDRRDP